MTLPEPGVVIDLDGSQELREQIARVLDPEAWEPFSTTDIYRLGAARVSSLVVADEILRLPAFERLRALEGGGGEGNSSRSPPCGRASADAEVSAGRNVAGPASVNFGPLRREAVLAALWGAASDGWSGDANALSPETAAAVLEPRIAALEALMIRWRIAAQKWTPGGSEYMDPAYCEEFIRERREDHHKGLVENARLRADKRELLEALKALSEAQTTRTPEAERAFAAIAKAAQ